MTSKPSATTPSIGATEAVLEEVLAERDGQDGKWGEQNWPDGTSCTDDFAKMMAASAQANCNIRLSAGDLTWDDILDEEIWEARSESDAGKLRAELIQIAAVAVAWVECIDRRRRTVEPPK